MIRFSANNRTLLAAFKEAATLIPTKVYLPIFANLLVIVRGDGLTVTSGDQETALTLEVPLASHEGEGGFCMDARKAVEFMKAVPDGDVTFTVDGQHLSVEYAKGSFSMAVIPGSDYPVLRDPDTPLHRVSFGAKVFAEGLARSVFAVSSDMLRPVLTAVLVDVLPDSLVFVASDTQILSVYRVAQPREGGAGWSGQLTVSRVASSRLLSLLPGKDSVEVAVHDNAMVFRTDGVTLRTKMVKGKYPPYQRVFPTSFSLTGSMQRDHLAAAVRRVRLATGEDSGATLDFRSGGVRIYSDNPLYALTASETVPCAWENRELRIGMSLDNLHKVLSTVDARMLMVKANAPDKPVVLVPLENEGGVEWSVLMMPMTMKG